MPTADSAGFGLVTPKAYSEGLIRLYAGDRSGAYEFLDSVRWTTFEADVIAKPQWPDPRVFLALHYAQMGWKEPALSEAARVIELQDSAKVPSKQRFFLLLAQVYAWAGEPDLAWRQLEQFLALQPSAYTINNFRLDPIWDPLRNDPRFQKLIEQKKP